MPQGGQVSTFRRKQRGLVSWFTQQRRERHLDAWLRVAPDTNQLGDIAEPVYSPDVIVRCQILEIQRRAHMDILA